MPVSCILCPVKRLGLAAVEKGWRIRGICRACTWREADGTACPKPAQSGHRCRRDDNSYSDLSGTGTILRQGCAQVLEAGHFC
ncbi:hypothetical protein DPMN_089767 [Dreissena polymorpha]|uniref:Uncharacterized protein n=1 Tax=Dreissena polymorpha TaxID=45954 RepID=A0A9D4KWZ0_DREPO|nr:hypothetical protein DPMN_089767 [Dreissena polymorpha]